MKDFLGKELSIGDGVVLIRPNYRQLIKAKVIRFTPKMVVVEYVDTMWPYEQQVKARQTPDQLVKV